MSDNETWQAPGAPTPPAPSAQPAAQPAAPPAAPPPASYGPPPQGPGLPPGPPPAPIASYAPAASLAPGGQPGWTPPPRPGLIALRPMTLGPILGASFRVMRRNPRATLGPALILSVLLAVVTAVGFSAYIGAISRIGYAATGSDAQALAAGSLVVSLLVLLVGGAAVTVATAVLQAIIVTEVARGTLGEKLTFGQLWKAAGKRIGAVVGYTLLLILAAVLAVSLFFGIITVITIAATAGSSFGSSTSPSSIMGTMFAVLGVMLLGYGGAIAVWLWLSTKLAFVPAAIVLERLTIRAAIARSWRLTKGYFWRTLGIQLLVSVMISFAAQVVTFPVYLIFVLAGSFLTPTGGSTADPLGNAGAAVVALIAMAVVGSVVSAVGLVLQSATASLLYLDLRMRKEGLDLELSRFVEARQTGADVADPYLPHPAAVARAAS